MCGWLFFFSGLFRAVGLSGLFQPTPLSSIDFQLLVTVCYWIPSFMSNIVGICTSRIGQ